MKKGFLVGLLLTLAASVFASDWYVCMGSFKHLDKAIERVEILNDAGFSVFINEVDRVGQDKLYRVLFSEMFKDLDSARFRSKELLELSKVKELNLLDIWCCESNGISYDEIIETPVTVVEQVPAEPQKQTVVVKVNNVEEQRFDITSDEKVIRVNINVDEVPAYTEPAPVVYEYRGEK